MSCFRRGDAYFIEAIASELDNESVQEADGKSRSSIALLYPWNGSSVDLRPRAEVFSAIG